MRQPYNSSVKAGFVSGVKVDTMMSLTYDESAGSGMVMLVVEAVSGAFTCEWCRVAPVLSCAHSSSSTTLPPLFHHSSTTLPPPFHHSSTTFPPLFHHSPIVHPSTTFIPFFPIHHSSITLPSLTTCPSCHRIPSVLVSSLKELSLSTEV